MVFSSDIRLPCTFQINRCFVNALCEDMFTEIEFDDWPRVERISVSMEGKICHYLAFFKQFSMLEVFQECFSTSMGN